MNSKTMTVHAALAELKMLDKRIEKKIESTNFMAANKASNTVIAGMPIEDFKEHIKEEYVSIVDLIAYRKAIKRAVTKSNAVTTVGIAGVEYTVAEAIWMKNEGVLHDMALLDKLQNQYLRMSRTCDMENENVEDKARRYAEEMYPANGDLKDRDEKIKIAMEEYRQKISFSIVSGISYLDEIKGIEGAVDLFMSEVDSALSVSNATTTITVEW